jgi:MYXO-CTERM domain-containing protein
VLVVGNGSAELFDPTSESFSQLGASPFASHAAVATPDGRVLLVGLNDATESTAQVFDPNTQTFTATGAPTSFTPGSHSLTLLRNGRVLVYGGCPCGSIGGPIISSNAAEVWDASLAGGTGAFQATGNGTLGRLGHTATLLPDGNVLILGALDATGASSAELYNPSTGTFSAVAESLTAARSGHTATLLPNGNVLIVGGEQASAELYLGGSSAQRSTFADGPAMTTGRSEHTETTLSDGRVLFAGGELFSFGLTYTAEIFDEATQSFVDAGAMQVVRRRHTATLLRDGRVLLTGGSDGTTTLSSAEVWSALGATGAFSATAALSVARENHTATVLPDGKVLIAGGSNSNGSIASAELFDPTSDALSQPIPMLAPMSGHGATLLRSGKVLLLGGSHAELFDPITETFAAAPSPGTTHADVELQTMSDGRVLVIGGDTLAGELFDPKTESFSFTQDASVNRVRAASALLPTGQALILGGQIEAIEPPTLQTAETFDAGAGSSGAFALTQSLVAPLTGHRATVLGSGTVLLTGGVSCTTICIDFPHTATQVFAFGNDPFRPTLSGAPSVVEAGTSVAMTGTRFRGPDSSGGQTKASTSNQPVVFWQPLNGPGLVIGRTTEWTDTTLSWTPPATTFTGLGWLRVAVNGMVSPGRLVEIRPAGLGIACEFDAECDSGSCADGVCCDAVCDGACEGCTAARKGTGEDGQCGEIPPGLSLEDACVISSGGPCRSAAECESGFCADGLCCQSACELQCEACDVDGSLGICVPVTGLPHGDRTACDNAGVEDPCDFAICDGQQRSECAGTVGPCGEFACGAEACLESCTGNEECATGYHCDDGACVAGQCEGATATTAEGEIVDCSPYTCRPDGTCKTSCSDVSDCQSPSACDFDGRCVPRPPSDVASSCDCTTSGGRAPSQAAWLLGVLAIASLRRRRKMLAAVAVAAMGHPTHAVGQPQPSQAQPTEPAAAAANEGKELAKEEAKKRFERGLALVNERAWDAALAEFSESVRLYPTRGARQNSAFCLRELGRQDEALTEYEALLRDYPDMDQKKKLEAQEAISALRTLVGSIEIDAAEPGAMIVIDGRQRGTYPTTAPLRVPSGSHVVRVFKQGFVPFETRVEVASRQAQRVEAKLLALTESGTLRIVEKAGKVHRVIVDQIEVGVTPFEGTLAVGAHVVVLQNDDGSGVAPTSAPIEKDRVTTLELTAVPLDAALRVEPTPAASLIEIDGVPLGRGTWSGALPSGQHIITISADGFIGQRRELTLEKDDPTTLRVALEQNPDDERWSIPGKFVVEATGALNLFPSYFGQPNKDCGEGCSAGVGLGGTALLHLAYEFGIGLGVGVSGGWFASAQTVEGRAASVQPVGLPVRAGLVDDELSLSGAFVGAHVSYRFGEVVPVSLRLTAGALLSRSRDVRTGRFDLEDGFTYQAGPIIESVFAPAIGVLPEVRVAYKLTESFEASLGLAVTTVIPLGVPRWEADREVDAAVDGIGAFGGEDLTGPAWFTASPSVGARYAF